MEVCDSQSEVVTTIYGEYFLAELMAEQTQVHEFFVNMVNLKVGPFWLLCVSLVKSND